MSQNIFAAEWRECLRAHYLHVVRVQDTVTEPSLTLVMREAGFSEAELLDLRQQATLHAENWVEPSLPAPSPEGEESSEAQLEVRDEPVIDNEGDLEPPQQLTLF
jgi:hypothetical protein